VAIPDHPIVALLLEERLEGDPCRTGKVLKACGTGHLSPILRTLEERRVGLDEPSRQPLPHLGIALLGHLVHEDPEEALVGWSFTLGCG